MDAQAKKKAVFRAKLREQQQKKRIDSDLVRYNQLDQLVCRVCDVVLRSDTLWPAHAASRKHHEAIANLKASASRQNQVNTTNMEANKKSPRDKADSSTELHDCGQSAQRLVPPPSSVLPADFFDNQSSKRQKADSSAPKPADSALSLKVSKPGQRHVPDEVMTARPSDSTARERESQAGAKPTTTEKASRPDSVAVKGALPEGFFDNKDADLRARGIEPVKPDLKDEYKEFEKSIQEDLQEVDNRFEEEEIDAAEIIEEEETVEQKTCRKRVELLKRRKMELKAARASKGQEKPIKPVKEAIKEGSSSDDDSDEIFAVNWRAQHL